MTVIALFVASLATLPTAERHRVFLEDEAHFLLTSDERTRFLALENDASRDRFIDRFWSGRDRAAHRERLEACDRSFAPRGRRSERGRVFQLLGPPSSREDFTRRGDRIVDAELWHYTGLSEPFLPETFYLVFFRRGGAGDLELWDPYSDGVAALIPATQAGALGLGVDPRLDAIDPELALAVESLVPGGSTRDAQSLLAGLDAFPELAMRARVFGARVSADVATHELASRLTISVYPDDAGVAELHYALELSPGESRHLRWRELDSRFRARVVIIGRIVGSVDERERWEDTFEIDVSAAEREALADTRLVVSGRRLTRPDDSRFELALVAERAATVVGVAIDHSSSLDAPAFERIVTGSAVPTRVIVRERTAAEAKRYHFARGASLAHRGERARAIQELELAAEIDMHDVRVHLELARLLYASGRHGDVLSVLGETEARFPGEVDAWVMLGAAAEALGHTDDALRFFERAMALAPDDAAIAAARERLVRAPRAR